ncbi:hypothetical protein A1Q1_02112 [Trichosporon asahii var. asahii CBS 2479]|uniref:Uncharacterized protein n=1 Tax=Trichosporon asahii var. asahii (strain ATCC 90039 / CBS 2479 / JCM 2466 / KCTC 7840 / NBRC 103889/ NCYC 2677 / UAMH 7654) TaxID=1186058 RepID=J5QSC7_TRIAS|nr:hypothetical protein A1Q1_02112 [Trichosporon asahii var. asahii CBS 2479]EJT48853.1 hypothetical protein A1Q1_02112 [Trichosporon asahii var. asahii CBS 2479]
MLSDVRIGVDDTPSVVDLCLLVAELTTRYTVENLPLPRTPSGALSKGNVHGGGSHSVRNAVPVIFDEVLEPHLHSPQGREESVCARGGQRVSSLVLVRRVKLSGKLRVVGR